MTVLAALLAFGWQAALVDFHRNEYLSRMNGEGDSIRDEILSVEEALAKTKSRSFHSFMLKRYRRYMEMQLRMRGNVWSLANVPRRVFLEANSVIIRLWCLNGSATPRFLMGVLCMSNQLDLFLMYVLTVGMGWSLALYFAQIRVDQTLLRRAV